MKNYELKDNAVEQRYEFDLDGEKAVIEYTREPNLIVLIHTYVPPAYEGRGIGRELVRAVLEDIRGKGLQVVPQCSFVAHYIRRNPDWEELLYVPAPTE